METSDGRRGFTQQCCSCDAPSARCWCVECNEALCDACVSAHGRVTVTRSHRILNQPPAAAAAASAGHVSTPPIKFCRLHPSERLILFCFTCGRLTCRDCQLMDHMNHRYQFVREAVNSLKNQLEASVQPIRVQRSRVKQSLRELEIRLQDIAESESHLISELQNSYTVICKHMKQRVEMLSQQARSVCETESSKIRSSVERLRRLQRGHQSLIDAAEKAATSDDVPTLLASTAQVRSELRTLANQDSSPPSLMSQMKVVTDAQFMETLLKFGELEVSWIPFSVSSNQSRVAPAASKPPPPSSSSSGALPPVPLNTSSSTPRSIAPSSARQTTPPSGPSPSAVTTVSLLGPNVGQVVMNKSAQPVAFAVNLSAAPPSSCTLNNYLQSPVVVNPPAARQQPPQPQVVLLSNNQMMYQVFPVMSNQQILPVATSCAGFTCSAPSLKPLPQATPTIVAKTLFQNNSLAVSWKSSTSEAGPRPSNAWMPPPRADIIAAPAVHCTTSQTSLQLRQSDLHPVTDKPPPPYSSALASLAQSQSNTDLHPLKDETAPPSSSSPSDVTPGPCQSAVVRAVADSACDLSAQQVTARPPESGEDEPTSTVYEETDPAEKPSEPSSVIGHTVDTLNQWQPTVSLVRLPVSLPKPGRPLPGFNLVPGEEEDEIYLEEMSEDTQSSVDDVTDDVTGDVIELPSSPESPVTLETVTCSACGSTDGSIICSACGRGYHRDTCHVPPVGPDLMSEWTCSLCQDLSDPSDPYSSDRPHRPQGPGLSVLDQRKCESLLLHLKVEGCSRLSESPAVCSDLEEISKRLTRHRAPSYQSAAEFLSDVWRLFDHMKDDDAVKKLQESFQSRCEELHPSVLKCDGGTSAAPETLKKLEVNVDKSKLTSMRKRLRDLLMTTASKKIKREDKPRLPGTSKQPITDIPVISLLDD